MSPRAAFAAAALAAGLALGADAPRTLAVGAFSEARADAALPAGWQPLEFPRIPRHTVYRLVEDAGRVVVHADADASASGLIRRVEADAKDYPVLAWRWKVADVIDAADPSRKEGDDYPARVYVAFKYDPDRVSLFDRVKYALLRFLYGEYPPHAGIAYVWDARLPAGTMLPNAYTDRVRMIVVRSGAADAGRWVEEERDLYADYRRAFAEEPPPISGVAIMTDADDTGARATAWYGDIVLRRR
jgi:hypothetical protein